MKQALPDRKFSRRSLARCSAALATGLAITEAVTEPLLAQIASQAREKPLSVGAVKINANENPLGPCVEAVQAMQDVIAQGGRYLYEHTFEFTMALAHQEALPAEYIQPFAGSSDPLHRTILAWTSPSRSLVLADPGYEAGVRATKLTGARAIPVKLTPGYAHDVRAMAAADPQAGVIYVCNPNNPTGTLTPRADIEWLLKNKPAGSILLLDEAYLHYSDAAGCADLAGEDKEMIVLRSFSKLYGMAGLRAGAAIGRPDLLARLKPWAAGALAVTGMVGATASLHSPHVVARRRKAMRDLREDTFAFLSKHNVKFIPSESSCFMLDAGRPGGDFIAAMARQNVLVGRVWPAMPNHSRISIGTADDMSRFKQSVLKVLA